MGSLDPLEEIVINQICDEIFLCLYYLYADLMVLYSISARNPSDEVMSSIIRKIK